MSLPSRMSRTIKVLFIGIGKTHRHAALMCLDLSSAPSSGKEKTMKTPKTPIEFDYDLWTTEDGKCMVRLKATGEECEVSIEIFRYLRAEEKRIRRTFDGDATLSLDVIIADDDNMTPGWLIDVAESPESVVSSRTLEEEFINRLTPVQHDLYLKCLCGGLPLAQYARHKNLHVTTVWEIRNAIREKYKRIFL